MAPTCHTTDAPRGPKQICQITWETLRELGYTTPNAELLTAEDGRAPVPEIATPARAAEKEGAFGHLAPQSSPDAVFGEHSGQSTTTARHVRAENTIPETIRELDGEGQIEAAVAKCEAANYGIDRPAAEKAVSYKLAVFAKGWAAEAYLASGDRFRKAAESNDIAGQDAYDTENDEYVQIKSVTAGYKGRLEGDRGNHQDADGNPVVFYQWDCRGNLHVDGDYTAANGSAAAVAGISKTQIGMYHSNNDFGGRRTMWW